MTPERWQQVDQLLEAVLELEASERDSYLAKACEGDEALRGEVQGLLAHSDRAHSLIESPPSLVAAEALAEKPASSVIGRRLGHYEILALLGAGGMGEVYRAIDLKLGRAVAVKLLARHLVSDETAKARFIREARAASALDHPNIATIHEIGEADAELFIAMALYEGETLKQRLEKGRLAADDALEVLRQVLLGLESAHAAGIVHRDIKPANILITRKGTVKILDFGLAKLVSDSQAQTMTQAGHAMGTIFYMSPEQLRGESVDSRSDLWSFGVLAYEMLSGVSPFQTESSASTAMRILNDRPASLATVAGIPDWLAQLVSQLLRKNPAERPLTATEVLRRIDGPTAAHQGARGEDSSAAFSATATAAVPSSASVAAAPASAAPSAPKRRRWLVPAAAALALLATARFFYFRRAQALTERDSLLLADFVNTTGEPVFDGTLKQALAVKLDESPFLNVVPEQRVRETLRLMNRSPDERLTTAIAREVCERQGVKAMLTGSIASLGSIYVIGLDAVNCRTGDSLARDYVEAESKEKVLTALGKAASTLRGKLGESVNAIQKFDAPIEGATTASLEALKSFTLGEVTRAKGAEDDAISFYERAIALDPNFALAYAKLGTVYGNVGEIDKQEEYLQKAFELRDRVTERERLYISHFHYFQELPLQSIRTLELWKQTYPRDWYPRNGLAAIYRVQGHHEKAVEEAQEALRLNPNHALPLANLAWAYLELNRFDEAKAVAERAIAQGSAGLSFHLVSYRIAFVQGDPVAMQKHADWARGKPSEFLMLFDEGSAAMFSGQLQKGEQYFRGAIELALRAGLKEKAADFTANQALLEAVCRNFRRAPATADSALKIAHTRIALQQAAIVRAMSGDTADAQAYVDELAKHYPTNFWVNSVGLPQIQAAIEIKRGNPSKAIELLKAASPYELGYRVGLGPIYARGQAYLGAQLGKEAAAEFQKILDHRGVDPTSPLYALAYLGLARAWAQAGDTAQSRHAYQDFLALWKDADPDIPILQQAKAEYAKLN